MSAADTAAGDELAARRRQDLADQIIRACGDILGDRWDDEPTEVSGWAHVARLSTVERDEQIRRALVEGHSLRTVAGWAGLTHPAVAKIRDRA